MLDENAFGILVAYHGVEQDEYDLSEEAFVARVAAFRRQTRSWLLGLAFRPRGRALLLGHAAYVEWPDPADELRGEQASTQGTSNGNPPEAVPLAPDPIRAARECRALLSEVDLPSVAVVTYGSRWVPDFNEPICQAERLEQVTLLDFGQPSEALRRALHAETACQGAAESEGWGPGLYLDTEAVEALGKRPQNEPTVLEVADATFYRAGR